ncbi:hypothetical protein ASE01_20840 [Nocardioides sp. Root190]|uniref:fibronectin type III domain-containing protein n=1 Tax=Nocardioides sp. Root190 TaxID=1736488 RepID=UPI0006FB6D1E|nr:fibronectin type III domain-containing protein [Nocardioides sp. Root190]KRB73207.1 hypothetical protein ASE01_20840 [Nocardioides sp. Root190]
MRFLARVLAASLLITLVSGVGLSTAAEAAARPTAPRTVKAAPLNKAVKVTWAAPARSSGSRVDAYAVQQRNSGTTKWVNVKYTTGSGRSATIPSLQNGALYYFRVLARNRSGWGSASASVAVRPRTVPTAPRVPEADAHNSALGVYWTVPFSTGGAAIDYYRVEISTDAATWTTPKSPRTLPTAAAPVLYTGLEPGARYWFRIRAHNAAGFSPPTGAGPFRVYAAPGPVTDLVPTPGNGSVALTWTAPVPASPWVTGVADYLIEQSTDGETWTDAGTSATTAFNVSGLTNGQPYWFRVSARSTFPKVGHGPTTETSTNGPTGPPTAPQNITLGWDETTATHVLDWDLPVSDGGSEVTGYDVRATQGGVAGTPVDVDGGATELAVGPLAIANSFDIRSCNAIGCGDWSNDIGPVPGKVTGLDGEALHGTSGYVVTLTWSAPSNGAVAPVSLYTVQRSTDGGAFTALGTSSTPTYQDTTAVADTDYAYRVVAVGADGRGAPATLDLTTGPVQAVSAPVGPVVVDEGEETSFLVTLAAAPAVDTVVAVTSDDPDAAAPTESSVTVLAGQTTATVTVAGTEDDDLVAASATLTVSAGALSDTVVVDVTDDDTQAVVLSADDLTVVAGAEGQVSVRLAFQPVADVTLTVSSDATNKATVTPAEVVLTPANYATPVALTIAGVSHGSATVTVSAPGLPDQTIEVTVD